MKSERKTEPWLLSKPYRFLPEDVLGESDELTGEQRNHLEKDMRRERRLSRHIRSRGRCVRDYCGATFHVSKRNEGRKPRA